MILVTNNDRVRDRFGDEYKVVFVDGSYKDVLLEIRARVHEGYQLLTHPLAGSIKPNETPYRSILISSRKKELDMDSLRTIENSIITYDKFAKMPRPGFGRDVSESFIDDYKEIDLALIQGALT